MQDWKHKLLSNSIWISIGILCGRFLGFIREAVLASRFGATADADVAVLLLTIPDFLVNILVGGGLSVALIPEFSRLGRGMRSQCLFVQSSLVIGIMFTALAGLLVYFSDALVSSVAPGFPLAAREQAAAMMDLVLWVIPLTTLAGVSTAYLQATGRFAVPAMGTFIFNTTVVAGLLFFTNSAWQLQLLGLFIILGGMLRLGSQFLVLPRIGLAWRCFRWQLLKHTVISRYFYAVLASGLLLSLPVIARAIASLHGEGAIALFNYASRLVEFPLSVTVTILAVGLFPLLSDSFSRNRDESYDMITTSLSAVVVIALAVLLPLGWFSEDISRLVFGWGKMENEQTEIIGRLLFIGLFALPIQGLSSVIVAIFNAKRDTKAMVPINLVAIVLFVPLSWKFADLWQLEGLMIAVVSIYVFVLFFQLVLLKRRHGISVSSLLLNINLMRAVLIMLVVGEGCLVLAEWFKGNVFLNVTLAAIVVAIMLAVGALSMGLHRHLKREF